MTDSPTHLRLSSDLMTFAAGSRPESGSETVEQRERLEDAERQLRRAAAKALHDAERLAELEQQIQHLQQDVVELSRALIRETRLREEVQSNLAARESEIVALHGSTSWRITGPLRRIRLALPQRS